MHLQERGSVRSSLTALGGYDPTKVPVFCGALHACVTLQISSCHPVNFAHLAHFVHTGRNEKEVIGT